MTSDKTIIINLIKTAWENHHGRPDYTYFCLTEAHDLLTSVTESFESMASAELSDRAELLNLVYPRDDVLITAAMARRSNKRDRLYSQRKPINRLWHFLAKSWCRMRGDYDKVLECCRNASVIITPEYHESIITPEGESLILLRQIIGIPAYTIIYNRMVALEHTLSMSINTCIHLSMAWCFLLGTNRAEEAARCLRKAESLAKSVGDWINCADGWNDLNQKKYFRNCMRCKAKAESRSRSMDDWTECARFSMDTIKDLKSADYCLNRARQCPGEPAQIEYLDLLSNSLRSMTTDGAEARGDPCPSRTDHSGDLKASGESI